MCHFRILPLASRAPRLSDRRQASVVLVTCSGVPTDSRVTTSSYTSRPKWAPVGIPTTRPWLSMVASLGLLLRLTISPPSMDQRGQGFLLGSFKYNACRLLEEAAYYKSELEKYFESREENLFQVFLFYEGSSTFGCLVCIYLQ